MFVDNLNSMIDDYAKTNGYNVLQRMFKDPFFQSYDYIIFDCKKSTDSFSKCQIDSSDCAIIPVEPSAYAFDAVKKVWINPDCGLKTRGNAETWPSLENLVAAAKAVRAKLDK